MKKRLSIFLIVVLTTFMVTCKPPVTSTPPPQVCDVWKVVSVTSSLSAV